MMKLPDFHNILSVLKIAPLVRFFRAQVESAEVPLEESVRGMARASELLVAKIRWLLPRPKEDAVWQEDDEVPDITGTVSAALSPAMEPDELVGAATGLWGLLGNAMRKYPRGATMLCGTPKTVVVSVDPRELQVSMRYVAAKKEPVQRTLVIPKWNFVAHLRSFWSEVRRLSREGVNLTFSRFFGRTKVEAIQNFLAFLELIKRRRVFATQAGPLGEIVFGTDRRSVSAAGDGDAQIAAQDESGDND